MRGMNYKSHVQFATDLTNGTTLRRRTPANVNFIYEGGAVISSAEVRPLFWGNNVLYTDRLPAFYGAVVNSVQFDMLSQYNTPTQSIKRGTLGPSATLQNPSINATLNFDRDIVPYLLTQFQTGTLPLPTQSTYYPIHFPPNIKVTLDNYGTTCQELCGFHWTVDITQAQYGIYNLAGANKISKYVYVGILSDLTGNCGKGCGGNADIFNNVCSIASHELIEFVTDPNVGDLNAPLGWNDDTNGEIGDLCELQQGILPGTSYTVQLEWSNKAKACVVA
ncbi:hypothetical protein HDU76_004750 [Blyttiomyces sp. JEL0837]|nr:hypothetical protein HDU76_004750 [Blyttiomyces sp. JEL0837]